MQSNTEVRNEELSAVLGAAVVTRRPWPYASSSPMEELELELEPELESRPGGRSGRVLFKDLTDSAQLPRPRFLADPRREIAVYRDVLGPLGIDAPALVAAVSSPERAWLFVELIDAEPLWQQEGTAAWEAAARWLAELHSLAPPDAARLLRYNESHLRARVELASAQLPRAAEIAPAVAAELARAEPVLIHGEFYPSNVLVQGAGAEMRIRVIDWEMTGVGPAAIDLAALTAGWPAAQRERIERAYADACAPSRGIAARDLDLARLLLACQWAGWSERWTPPPEHARDWIGEATALIEKLGL